MLVPISWLKDYVDVEASAEEVSDILTNAGLEVKHIRIIGSEGADLVWAREQIVLSRLLKVEQHPDADRLVIATVDYGGPEPKAVVTGAPNLFPFLDQGDIADLNLFSPLAMEGARLYDGHKAELKIVKLKGRKIRGIYNDAMLCSEKELGISEEHEGIILICQDEDSPEYKAGTPLVDLLGDAVLEIDIIPNIARCASIIGVAREFAALTRKPLRYPDWSVKMEGPDVAPLVKITTENPELNPRFAAMLVEGVEQKESPYWMQYRLKMAGQRPINVVVDISNYVMIEMGQPNHTFDFDFLRKRADVYDAEGPVHIITRLPREGETLTTLDGIEHTVKPFTMLVTDPKGNLSMGGIMGGENSEIKPDTKDVLVEAAAWNFINIRKSATQLGINTDAAFRFSRGVHPSQALLGAKRAAELLRRLAGGTVANGIIDTYPAPPEKVTVSLSPEYVRRLSGLDLTVEDMEKYLNLLEFETAVSGDELVVTAPDHRMDIEGPHDLVEEICRMYGYDNIPYVILADDLPAQHGNPELEKEELLKDILAEAGMQEVITYRLTSAAKEAKLFPGSDPSEREQLPYVTLTNPISTDRSVMRRELLASVLDVAAANSRFQDRIAVFEIGDVYLEKEKSVLPDEYTRLAVVLTGRRSLPTWSQNGGGDDAMDFFDLKGVMERLFEKLHVDVAFQADDHPAFRPGRTAAVFLGDVNIGVMGEIHPLVADAFDFQTDADQPVLAADLDLEKLLSAVPDTHGYGAVSQYPAIHEDLAIVTDCSIPAARVVEVMADAGGALLKHIELFDLYEGSQVPEGKRSLAYHLTIQAPDRTLTDKDASKVRNRIIKQLDKRIGATLRV